MKARHADRSPGRVPPDRAPRLAALVTAAPMLAVAAFWALLGLLGGNGMQGAKATWFLFGYVGAGLLALLLSPWLALSLCRRSRARGWHATLAVASASMLSLGIALLALLVTSVALATLSTPP